VEDEIEVQIQIDTDRECIEIAIPNQTYVMDPISTSQNDGLHLYFPKRWSGLKRWRKSKGVAKKEPKPNTSLEEAPMSVSFQSMDMGLVSGASTGSVEKSSSIQENQEVISTDQVYIQEKQPEKSNQPEKSPDQMIQDINPSFRVSGNVSAPIFNPPRVELTFSEQIHVPTRAEVIESLRESKAIVKFRNFVRIDTLSIENIKLQIENETLPILWSTWENFSTVPEVLSLQFIYWGFLDVSEEM
jgi:hypothetical protein